MFHESNYSTKDTAIINSDILNLIMSRRNRKRKIVKKNGHEELFLPEKLCESITAVGVPEGFAKQVCSIVNESVESGVSTDKIFVTTRKYINEFDPKLLLCTH